jgi:glutaconate CoA-transferase subunit A
MPVAGLWGSDIPERSGLKTVRDPYSGAEVYVVPALRPDWAVLHVHEADAQGNARVYGSPFWDRSMSRAARQVIITAERIVDSAAFARQPELTLVPHFLVAAVAHVPNGAWPAACFPEYDVDHEAVRAYLAAVREPDGLRAHLTLAGNAAVGAR